MEENKNKKGLIIVVIFVLVFLMIFVIFPIVLLAYLRTAKKDNLSDNTTIMTMELNQGQKKIYDSLITATGTYGFYFDKSVTIDDIEDDKMLGYVLDQYSSENGISFDYNIYDEDCSFPDYESEDDNKMVTMEKVKKEIIDDYIKTKFNTNRIFTLKNDDDLNCSIYNRIISGTKSYVYTPSDNSYGFGYFSASGEYNKVYTKFLKAEQNKNEIIFYDNALVCKDDTIITCGTDEQHVDNLFSINVEKEYDKELLNHSDEVLDINVDYVFGQYAYEMHKYKHTFKKADDGKYYWYSSELVK